MPRIPILSARRDRLQQTADKVALNKAAGAVAGLLGPGGGGGASTGSWYGGNSTSNAGNQMMLRAQATQQMQAAFGLPTEEIEQALIDQGMGWGGPFSPGRPLSPFQPVGAPARVRDYTVGENVQITPRAGRISFATLKALYDNYDVPQIATQHLVNDVRTLACSWVPADGVKSDVTADVLTAQAFFRKPDRRRPFFLWIAQWLQDIIRWDAGTLYVRRNLNGEPIALEVVDGTTIMPLTDFYGRLPMDEDDATLDLDHLDVDGRVTPAYQQIIQGMPWVWMSADDLIYQPLNPVSNSEYGLAPLEKVLLTANTDIRFQWHFLQYFTDGSLPAGFMEAPPDQSSPEQIKQFQQVWDELMVGDQSQLNKVRFVPHDSSFTAVKSDAWNPDFPLYLMRRVCAAHGVTPADLGFTDDVNRATGDTQIDVQFRVGTLPYLRYIESVLSDFAQDQLGLKVRLKIDDGREVEDRVATAQAHSIYINAGVESADEVRSNELGLAIDKTQPVGRFIITRTGLNPLEAVMSQNQLPIDPETYAPEGKVTYRPPVVPPGQSPSPGHPGVEAAGGSEQADSANSAPAGQKPAVPGGADAANTAINPTAKSAWDKPWDGRERWDDEFGPDADAVQKTTLGDRVGDRLITGLRTDHNGVRVVDTRRDNGWEEFGVPLAKLLKAASAGTVGKTSGMVSLDIAPGVVKGIPNGVSDHHITIVFLGRDVDDDLLAQVCDTAEAVAELVPSPLKGTVSGVGSFPASNSSDGMIPVFTNPDVPGLDGLRAAFERFNASEHTDFKPHVTLAYQDADDPMPDPVPETPIEFTCLSVHRGDEVHNFPFGGATKTATAGLTAATGIQGVDLPGVRPDLDDDDEEDDDDEDELDETIVKAELRRWRDNSRARLRKGQQPRRFSSTQVPDWLLESVWKQLQKSEGREQVDAVFDQALGDVSLGKAGAARSQAAFHRHTDQIVAHYLPKLQAALREQAPIDDVTAAADQALTTTGLGKAVADKPGAAEADDDRNALEAALREVLENALVAARGSNSKIVALLTELYGDAALQGAYHAAHAASAMLPDWLMSLDLPTDYWSNWTPGWGEAAAKVAGGGLQQLLQAADVTIRGLQSTAIGQLATHLATGLAAGDPIGKTARAARGVIADPKRADMIVNTEYARAMTAASLDTYQANNVAQLEWLAEKDACDQCSANAALGATPISEMPAPPAHPRCRCAVVPVIDV